MYSTGEDVVCIYREGSLDGFAGAWCVWRTYPNATFVPTTGELPQVDITGKHVYIIDFAYPMNVLADFARVAQTVRVIDHHEAFQQQLSSFRGLFPDNLHIIFDMQSSGAGLAWDFFNFHQPRPALITYIEDRSLWRFQYPESRAITAALQSYPLDFRVWDRLIFQTDLNQLLQEGEILLRKLQRDIDQAITTTGRRVVVEGYNVPAVNLHPGIVSDACSQLARGEPFAIGYWDTPQGRKFSLHSTDQGVDVAQLARVFGGTGSHNVANFVVPREHPLSHM